MDGRTTVSMQAAQPWGPLRTPQPDGPDNGDEAPTQRNRLTEGPPRSPTKSGPGWAKAEWEHRRAAAPGRSGSRGDALPTRPRRLPRPAPGLPAWDTPAWETPPPKPLAPKRPAPKPLASKTTPQTAADRREPQTPSQQQQETNHEPSETRTDTSPPTIPRDYGGSVVLSAMSGPSLNHPCTTVFTS
jgi:hypothetical protein